jgi:phage recombination protein Bet
MTNEIAVQATTELSIEAEQAAFTDAQIAAVRRMAGVEDVPEPEIAAFFHQCKRTGLDPFAKQIYLIARTKRKKVGPKEWVDDGHTFTIQTGIDGYRVLGHRVARARGDELAIPSVEWRSKTIGWEDSWLDELPPAAARATIVVNGNTYTATAMYSEFVQLTGSGDYAKPNSMWAKMPANQLAKCAESAAWRLAYPNDFAGLVLEDAVQVIDESGASVRQDAPARRQTRAGGRGVAGIRSAIAANKPEPEPAAVVERDKPVRNQGPHIEAPSQAALDELSDALDEAGITGDAERGAYLSEKVGRELSSWEDMSANDVDQVTAIVQKQVAAGKVGA